jgi:hypothetical protein
MRQTLSISVFVNFDLSFQPSDNLYTMLVRLFLLQIITKTYLSKKVNRWGGMAGKSPPYGRCGVVTEKAEFAFIAPAVAMEPPRTFPWADRLCWLSLSKRNC